MKQVKRSLCPHLCKDCPVMEMCKNCYDCANCYADKIHNFFGVVGYAKPNDCYCMHKTQANDRNRETCSLKLIIERIGQGKCQEME